MRDLTNYGRLDQQLNLSMFYWQIFQRALQRASDRMERELIADLFITHFQTPLVKVRSMLGSNLS